MIEATYWITGRRIANRKVRSYLYFSGIGYIMLFTSNYPLNSTIPSYPPFGIIIVPYLALSIYLIFFGTYSAVFSVANDNELRLFIRKSIHRENLLRLVATSERSSKLERSILAASKISLIN